MRRGDCNSNGTVDIADPLFLGARLFDPAVNDFPCREACEVNDDGQINIADMITSFTYLFAGGPPPRRHSPIAVRIPTPGVDSAAIWGRTARKTPRGGSPGHP